MSLTKSQIKELPTSPERIENTADCVPVMQQLIRLQIEPEEIDTPLQYLVAVIKKESQPLPSDGCVPSSTVLNLAFRGYFLLLKQHQRNDEHFQDITTTFEALKYNNDVAFLMLSAVLQTDYAEKINYELLKTHCVQALVMAIDNNENSLFHIVRALNVVLQRRRELVVDLSLDHIYFCMQTGQQNMLLEILHVFKHCCINSEKAFAYFQVITTFWPWTNRNKLYLLSRILAYHSLKRFLAAAELSIEEFFSGLRLSLSYQSLLSPSQYLVIALSRQDSQELLETCVEIFMSGTQREIQNLYSQWFSNILQKDEFFRLMQTNDKIVELLQNAANSEDTTQHYRLIILFGMFSKQIFELSKLHFFKLSTELITNCFHYEEEAQLLIFRFVINNLSSFALEDILEFLLNFMRTHNAIESSQFRNTMLGKMTNIINYVAMYYRKMRSAQSSSLEESILNYFRQLQVLIEEHIGSSKYQPKIFALKLLSILMSSLYAKEIVRNSKNCCTSENQLLGKFLLDLQVFDSKRVYQRLVEQLNEPQAFEDAMELIVKLLGQLKEHANMEVINQTREFCLRTEIDECLLSIYYGKASMKLLQTNDVAMELFGFCFKSANSAYAKFQSDPLQQCSEYSQIFGFLFVMNGIIEAMPKLLVGEYGSLLQLLRNILLTTLDMLNLCNVRIRQSSAASFQDMDQSLQTLVQESSHKTDNPEVARKFLLLSFWITMKACCELGATIGITLVPTKDAKNVTETQLLQLEQCIEINALVLTKCRHKGAFESAGVFLGRIVRKITAQQLPTSRPYQKLAEWLEVLLDDSNQVSTTRRGAGFAIMFLHIVKNEDKTRRPLLKLAMQSILKKLKRKKETEESAQYSENVDRIEALTLHYLCVLVKDGELRESMAQYQNEIMLAAIAHIDHPDWTVCNAALQLFGALVPKIVGQRQPTEFETPLEWAITELTYSELSRKLPYVCEHILNYCAPECINKASRRTLILFMEFLSNAEYLRKSSEPEDQLPKYVTEFRELLWRLLRYHCEKIRKLAALAFVRLHECHTELPQAMLEITKILFSIKDENFFQSLLFVLHNGLLKLEVETMNGLNYSHSNSLLQQLRANLVNNLSFVKFNPYSLSTLLKLLTKLELNTDKDVVNKVLNANMDSKAVGYDMWLEQIQLFQTVA